ncbi:hypothetical protein N7G274_010580 [Stereocaulon virgatum]|uniref:F-box domain-containing protein n=1 Tax=Stereocaulon virgatum TaxID=373712 RepID=A0ABR3ZVE6_9LECA
MAGLTLNVSHAGTPMPSDKPFKAHSRLSPEILIMIFEVLPGKDPSISRLRLVSKQFNDLVLPIWYRHVVLNDRIVDFSSSDYNYETAISYKMQVKRDISRYAQHIVIKKDFHERNLKNLLLSIASFRSLTISYRVRGTPLHSSVKTGGSTMSPGPSMDAFLLHLAWFRNTWPNLRICIENLDTQRWQMPQVEALHDSQVMSLKIEEWYKGHADPDLDGIEVKKLLFNMRQMKVLHLNAFESEATMSDSNLSAADRLPALEELVLHGYDWQFSAITAVTFWNWSKITHLELIRVTILPFLRTVPPENLLHLKTFVCDSFSRREPSNWDEANSLLCKLVRRVLDPEK